MTANPLWPRYATPDDLTAIETVALGDRGLPSSTYDVLARAANAWPDRLAVSVLPDGQRWEHARRRTFAQLLRDVHRVANLLRAAGVDRGDAVALIAPNCDQLITATLAAQLAGIAAPINGALSAEHVSDLVRRSGARVLIAADEAVDPAAPAIARHLVEQGLIDTVLWLTATDADAPDAAEIDGARTDNLQWAAMTYTDDRFLGATPRPDELAALFHTGGTTGAPKLAAHTHANEVTDAWMIAANSLLDDRSVIFAALPLFHVNALVVTTLAPLLRGQQVVWAGPLGYRDTGLYANFWKIVERYRLSTMSAVPTVYSVLAQMPVDADISCMRFAVVGASALPAAVRTDFETHTGIPLVEGYGLTEATCASARSFPDHPRAGSVGQRLPYQHIKTVHIDDDGVWHNLPCGEVGTVVISGPTVFAGYVVDHTADGYLLDGLGKVVDGWLDTGDLGWVDDQGFLHLSGRAKDLIIRGGHNIDPAVIEDALLSHREVTGAAAVGRPDAHAGEVPVAYVTLAPGATVDPDTLRRWAGEVVAEPAAAPKAVHVVDSLPVTAVGKPYKMPLRADAARSAVLDALFGIRGVRAVDAAVEGSTPVVTVTAAADADHQGIDDALSRFTITYRITEAAS